MCTYMYVQYANVYAHVCRREGVTVDTHTNVPIPHTHLACWILVKHTKYGQLGCHSLATPGRGAKQHTVVGVEHRVEDLSLYGVEVVKGEQTLILGVLQGSCGERLKVEEVGVRWVDLREDEVFEGDWSNILCTKPAIGDCPHIVLRREVLQNGDGEYQFLWCFT